MNYWEQRKKQLENQLEKDEKLLKSKLNKVYDTELSKLEKEIASYYQRYGVDNVIEYRTLLQKLPKEDVKLLIEKMDKFSEKYPQYKHLLPVRESIYKLNRLEGLQQSIVLQQYDIGAIEETALREHLTKYATLNANNTAEYLGFGKNFYFYNSSVISSLVNEKWCNDKNFSDRIWGNRQKLADFLNREFAQAIARGDSYERIMKAMRQKFDKVSRNDMFRLIYTEDTYIQAESSIRQFEELGDEQYRISVVKDGRTCHICKEKAQKVYNIKDRTPGENFPPFHPWCRCTFTIEENEDHETWLNNLVEQRNEEKFEKALEIHRKGGTIDYEKYGGAFIKKSFEELEEFKYQLPNDVVRKWYVYHDRQIPLMLDDTLNLEDKARLACDLRNKNRTQARDLMSDLEERKRLDEQDPNKTFEELIEHKMQDKGMTMQEAYEDIVKTASKTRKSVDKKFGVD